MSQAMRWYQLSATGITDLSVSALEDTSTYASIPSIASQVAPSLRGLAYGDGFFSTIGVHDSHLLWQTYHQARIDSHCQALQLTLSADRAQRLWQQLQQFASSIGHGLIKLIFSRPTQSLRGYAYSDQAADNEALIWIGVMQTAPLAQHSAQFLSNNLDQQRSESGDVVLQQPPLIAKCLQSQLASLPKPLAGLKSLNRLDGVMIAGELQRHKQAHPELAEGLVADLEGNWVEGVMSNVFYRLQPTFDSDRHDQSTVPWYTPPIEQSGVRGVMRQVIIDLLNSQNLPVYERNLEDADLEHLESMFFCNAVRGVMPVEQLWFQDHRFQLCLAPFNTKFVSI